MKKIIIAVIVCILMSTVVLGASVSRDLPSRMSPGDDVTVNLKITSISLSDVVKTFAIEETIPSGFSKISEWSIAGIEESKDDVKTDFSGKNYKFEFTPSGAVTITYKTKASSVGGSYDFKATWFDLSGMSGANDGKSKVTVRVITCGDGFCEGDETALSCEADCKKPEPPKPEPVVQEEEEKSGFNMAGWIIAIAIVVIGLIIYFVVTKKKKPIKAEDENQEQS